MKPKILHIIDSFSKGGAEVLLSGVVPELTNFEHYIIYLTYTKSPLDKHFPAEINVECLNFKGLSDIKRVLRDLNTCISSYEPVLIHTHLYFSSLLIRFLKTNNISVIQTYHNEYYRIRYPQYTSRIKKVAMKLLDRYTMKDTYKIIHVSNTQKKVNDFDVKIKSSSVIYNCIEEIFFQSPSRVLYNKENKLRIISIGNLKSEKNHMLLLKALQYLKHIPIHVNICGQGVDERRMQQYINKHSLPVTILGNRDDIFELFKEHDLFVSCSIIEGFGISVAEAMAAEIPMIISNIATFQEITQHKAFFFESKNAHDLANKIEAFYLSPTLINQATMACKKIAENYKKDYYVNQLDLFYKKTIEEKY